MRKACERVDCVKCREDLAREQERAGCASIVAMSEAGFGKWGTVTMITGQHYVARLYAPGHPAFDGVVLLSGPAMGDCPEIYTLGRLREYARGLMSLSAEAMDLREVAERLWTTMLDKARAG